MAVLVAKNSEKNKVFECSVQQWIITSGGWLTDLLKGQSQLSISLELRSPSCWLWFKTTWFQTKTLAVIGLFQKINFVFYGKGSTEPISLNHYGRSCDVTRSMWCVFLRYFFIPQHWLLMWAALGPLSSIPTGTGFPCWCWCCWNLLSISFLFCSCYCLWIFFSYT